MNFNQSIGGTFHRSFFAQRPQQAPHQRGLAGAEVAFEPKNEAWHDNPGQRGTQCQGGRLIRQV